MRDDELVIADWKRILKLAAKWRMPPTEIEKSFLRSGIIPQRYSRNITAIRPAEQKLLLDARVGVCGCGGLGLHIITNLARIGVGHITFWDPDVFSESNLNRQLLSSYGNLGQKKVEVCSRFIKDVNPGISVTAVPSRWEEGDLNVFARQQVIVDALDNIPSRLSLVKACAQQGIPMVHGAAGGWYGQFTVILPGDEFLQRIYGDTSHSGIEEEEGILPFTAAVIANLQAAETVKLMLKRESDMIEHICMVDLLDMSIEKFKKV